MNYSFGTILLAILLMLPLGAFSEEEKKQVSGSISAGGQLWDQDHDSAKAEEYGDLGDSFFGAGNLDFYGENYFFRTEGKNIGLDDPSFMIKGGSYGNIELSYSFDEIVHNRTFDALTFYRGVGTDHLTYSFTGPTDHTDPSTWDNFDYEKEIKKNAVSLEILFNKPFYIVADYRHVKRDGVKHAGSNYDVVHSGYSFPVVLPGIGASPPYMFQHGFASDTPEPIDDKTSTVMLETGYNTGDMLFSLKGVMSKFKNRYDHLRFEDPYANPLFGWTEVSSLPDDNTHYETTAKAALTLPLRSRLALKGSYSKTECDFTVWDATIDPNAPPSTVGPFNYYETWNEVGTAYNPAEPLIFEGEIIKTAASGALSSRPLNWLKTRFHFNYYKRENNSTNIDFTEYDSEKSLLGDPNPFSTMTTTYTDYEKIAAGMDFDFKLPKKTKILLGYAYGNVERDSPSWAQDPTAEFNRFSMNRRDAEETTDHKFIAQLKIKNVGPLNIRVKGEHLDRESDSGLDNVGVDQFDPDYIFRFVSKFDVADKKQDKLGINLECTPSSNLSIGLAYDYIVNDYDETILGRTDDRRHEVYLDAVYEVPKKIWMSFFAGYENHKVESQERHVDDQAGGAVGSIFGHPPFTLSFDPFYTGPVQSGFLGIPSMVGHSTASYNWAQTESGDYWTAGCNISVPIILDKLTFSLSGEYQKSDNRNEFFQSAEVDAFHTRSDIGNVSDYSKYIVKASALYHATKNIKVTLGYVFEKFDYSDHNVDNFTYYEDDFPNTFNRHLYSGADTDYNYTMNVGYVMVSYLF